LIIKEFEIIPKYLQNNEIAISVLIHFDLINKLWNVNVILSKSPHTSSIIGTSLKLELLDSKNNQLEQVERPIGFPTEVGGSLGVSANAKFKFRSSDNNLINL
jgi:hypothetical protein